MDSLIFLEAQGGSGWTMCSAQGLRDHSSTAQLVPVESTPAHMLKMLESDVNMVKLWVQEYNLTPCIQFPECDEGGIRLSEGLTALEGRVEVCRNGSWGTVCISGWNTNDARVVCRQLGLSTAGK